MSVFRQPHPIWNFVDPTTGISLNDNYYVTFIDQNQDILSPVYRNPGPVAGNPEWENPKLLTSAGNLPTNVYFDEAILYQLEVREQIGIAPDSNDPLLYIVQNFPSTGASGGGGATTIDQTSANMITNPQFVEVDFESSLVFTAAGTYPLAPGWDLVLAGPGIGPSVTVTREPHNTGSPVLYNAPFTLNINAINFTSVILRQTLRSQTAIFNNQQVSTSVTASSAPNGTLTVKYVPNGVGANEIVLLTDALTGALVEQVQVVTILGVINAVNPPDSFINLDFVVPSSPTGTFLTKMTNVNWLETINSTEKRYVELTTERQIDNTYHIDKIGLEQKETVSHMVGWDFAVNPRQFGNSGTVTLGNPAYAYDQTILQTAGGDFNWSTIAGTGAIRLTAPAATSSAALIQYLDGDTAKRIVLSELASNVRAWSTVTDDIKVQVKLFRANGATPFPLLSSNLTIGTLATNGDFALTATAVTDGWTEIPTSNLSNPTVGQIAQNVTVIQSDYDLGFSGWAITDNADVASTQFAMVVTLEFPTISKTVDISSISLVDGTIPTRPAPQTVDQVLQECRHYYEKSYPAGTTIGSIQLANVMAYPQEAFIWVDAIAPVNVATSRASFQIDYMVTKRTIPTVATYTPRAVSVGGGVNFRSISGGVFNNELPIGQWTILSNHVDRIYYESNVSGAVHSSTGAAIILAVATLELQYTSDARIGLI